MLRTVNDVLALMSEPHFTTEATASAADPKLQPVATGFTATDRRRFLVGASVIGAALVVGFRTISPEDATAATTPVVTGINPLNGYVRIAPDGKVTVLSSQFEMGQGSYNGIATLVAEELGADFTTIDVEGASGNVELYGNVAFGGKFQGTGGSTSMVSSWTRYRIAGAVARLMLVAAAAQEWTVPAKEIKLVAGILSHPSGKTASIGAFVAKAATMPVPETVVLKNPSEWTLIGTEGQKRFDSARKANGTQIYTIDIQLPGMLTAVMLHPPRFGSVLKSFDASKAKAVKGVTDVVAVPRGVAVVAENMWAAIKGRELVTAEWDDSKAETRSSAAIMAEYRALVAKPGAATARKPEGDIDAAFASAAKVIEATFEFPYLAHAPMEPLNAVARMNADGTLELWGGHQFPDVDRGAVAAATGVDPTKITLHIQKSGGSFGRRAQTRPDIAVEAATVAKAIGWKAPVKVQWTRENDIRGGNYRPAYVHHFKAGISADGRIVAWKNHIVGQSIMSGTMMAGMVQGGVDPTSVEGAANIPYAIPQVQVDLTTTNVGVPVLWWRSVGSTHTAYAVEAFLDELAEAAGKDPVALRLSMLEHHPRHAAVLKLAADKAGWDKPAAPGRFRGIAVAEAFNSFVAQVAEISVLPKGGIKVERVVCAVDCGIAINPDQIRAQMEGGIGFGLGAIMGEELTLTDGHIDQSNFDAYTPLRINAMPQVEVHIVPSTANPTGVGEPGVPPIGPAVANAIYKATGKRIRVLPFTKSLSA